jgi:hypothetical protein
LDFYLKRDFFVLAKTKFFMKKNIIILIGIVLAFSCTRGPKKEAEENKASAEAKVPGEWIILFDGKSLDGWRAYNGETMPPGWLVKDGEMTFDTELGLEQGSGNSRKAGTVVFFTT